MGSEQYGGQFKSLTSDFDVGYVRVWGNSRFLDISAATLCED